MFKLHHLLGLALVVSLTGCAKVGDHVGGPNRCMTYSYGACVLKVENGMLLAGSTLDLHGRTENYIDADVRESGLRHAFSGITDNGGVLIGASHNPTEKPLLQ